MILPMALSAPMRSERDRGVGCRRGSRSGWTPIPACIDTHGSAFGWTSVWQAPASKLHEEVSAAPGAEPATVWVLLWRRRKYMLARWRTRRRRAPRTRARSRAATPATSTATTIPATDARHLARRARRRIPSSSRARPRRPSWAVTPEPIRSALRLQRRPACLERFSLGSATGRRRPRADSRSLRFPTRSSTERSSRTIGPVSSAVTFATPSASRRAAGRRRHRRSAACATRGPVRAPRVQPKTGAARAGARPRTTAARATRASATGLGAASAQAPSAAGPRRSSASSSSSDPRGGGRRSAVVLSVIVGQPS